MTPAFLLLTMQTTGPRAPIETPSKALSYGGFYTKQVLFQGMPILASPKVEDRALRVIVATFDRMLARVPKGTMRALVDAGCHYSIIADEEGQTDLPEYSDLRNDPNMDWNKRARGLGGQYTSGGEENILELPSDRYVGESIFIHEFAHTLHGYGFSKIVPNFERDVERAFDAAKAGGLWKDTYALSNPYEYFAEGVQSYFDCNRVANPPNGIHNHVGNRAALKAYDPRLFAIIDRVFGGNPWRYEGKYNTSRLPSSPLSPSSSTDPH